MSREPYLVYVVTDAKSVFLITGRLAYLRERGFKVHLVSSPGKELIEFGETEKVEIHPLTMKRGLSLIADFISIVKAYNLLNQLKPDIVDAGTPKAGLIFTLAAFFCRVPVRVYTLRGLRFETTRGFLRLLLINLERITCACAHRVICVSNSLKQKAIDYKLAPKEKFVVFGCGSSNGVAANVFSLTPEVEDRVKKIKDELQIGDSPVIGFVGRLVKDKGVEVLIDAYLTLKAKFHSLRLLMIGPQESDSNLNHRVKQIIGSDPGIIWVRTMRKREIVPYYHLMDVLVLPTFREGFPNVVLEAAAAGKPVVTTDATGAIDSVINGVTGFVVPVGDSSQLADAICRLLENPKLAKEMGQAGRRRVVTEFQPIKIWQGVEGLYRDLLKRVKQRRAAENTRTGIIERQKRASNSGKVLTYPLKRPIDIVLSLIGLTIFLPLIVLITMLILITSGRPVFFVQPRPGLKGRPFRIIKFRTMRTGTGSDEERVTKIGAFLRRYSLDELPELWNVLKGEMSLVGPRPLLMEYLDRYTPEQARRHNVKPGITGWAQVNGRNAITWEEKFALDLWYVENISLVLDLKILAMTLIKVLKAEGISQRGKATVEEFKGTAG